MAFRPFCVLVLISWVMNLDDLEKKAAAGTAKVLLLSHMRSKVSFYECMHVLNSVSCCGNTPE